MKIAVLLLTVFAASAAASPSRGLNFGAPPPDVDECLVDNGGCSHCCTNYDYLVFEFSFKCSCPEGWTMMEDGVSCTQDLKCPEYGCSHMCAETEGALECVPAPEPVCSCPGCADGMGEGHVLDLDGMTCVDVDECAVLNGGCSDECVNTPGCYECACPGCTTVGLSGQGLVLDVDGMTCVDVDECATENGCSDICINTVGCYECSCPGCTTDGLTGEGFVLVEDGMTCDDVDECAVNNGGCSDVCVNTPGCFFCECPPGCDDPELPIPAGGYSLSADGTCSDIDECSAAGWEGACAGLCENEPGCYACISADVTTDYKMSLTLIMHEYLVEYMNESVFAQMVADTIGIDPQYIQIDSVAQVGEDTEVGFTWYALDATTFVTLLLAVEQIDWVPILIDYMQVTLPAGAF